MGGSVAADAEPSGGTTTETSRGQQSSSRKKLNVSDEPTVPTRHVIVCVCGRRWYVTDAYSVTCNCGAFYYDIVIKGDVFRFNADTNACFK